MQRFLDKAPLIAFAMEQGAGGTSVVDALEGAGVGSVDGDVLVSFVGVVDEAAAQKAASAWLVRDGWVPEGTGFTKNERSLTLLTHRGTLYALMGEDSGAFGRARSLILEAPAAGLEATYGAALAELSAGGLVLVSMNDDEHKATALWQQFVGTLRMHDASVEADGVLVSGKGALWALADFTQPRLLSKAPEGPVAVFSSSAPVETLLSLVFGPELERRAKRFDKFAGFTGVKYSALERALGPGIDVAAYFDTAGFLQTVVEREGRPQPRGTLVAQVEHKDRTTMEALLQGAFRLLPFPLKRTNEGGISAVQTNVFGQGVDVAVGPFAAFLKLGSPLKREAVDVLTPLTALLEGAFTAGHVSAFIDVARLRQELETPVFIKGLDARQVVAAQASARQP